MIFSAACWLVVIWFMDPEYEARHPGLFRRCAWVAIVLCCLFACTHYVYRFTTSFQLLFGALPSRGSTRSRLPAGSVGVAFSESHVGFSPTQAFIGIRPSLTPIIVPVLGWEATVFVLREPGLDDHTQVPFVLLVGQFFEVVKLPPIALHPINCED